MANFDFEIIGNIHIHSCYSDGAGDIAEIAHTAERSGLDFVIINDHEYMTDKLHLEDERYYGHTGVLVGLEIGGRYHHYLAFGLKEKVRGKGLEPQEVIDRVNSQGGFGFLAHPFEKGMPFKDNSIAYTWNDLNVNGFKGICIWNFSSRWKERVKSPLHGLFFLLFKAGTLKGPSRTTLSFWDSLCGEKKMVAVGGSDAHGSMFNWGILRFTPLPYAYTLNTINLHLLLERPLSKDFAVAKARIYEAMKEGRLFIAHERIAPAKGFRFYYQGEHGMRFNMGEERAFEAGTLFIETPKPGEIRLLRNGILQQKWADCRKVSFELKEKGVYRVEVYRRFFLFGHRPWIFSNPIYLR